jgi:hypothetical protein
MTEMPNSGMSDEEAYAYYADPDNREPAGPGRRRRTRPMSSHVPVRFAPEVIAEVKQVAQEDKKTVSSWIRDTVERELERRRPRYPTTRALPGEERFAITGLEAHVSGTLTGVLPVLENA